MIQKKNQEEVNHRKNNFIIIIIGLVIISLSIIVTTVTLPPFYSLHTQTINSDPMISQLQEELYQSVLSDKGKEDLFAVNQLLKGETPYQYCKR